MPGRPDAHHDVLARIVALLLGLAMLAERAASRPSGVRLAVLHILMPARHAALALMDLSAEGDDAPASLASHDEGALLHLAIIFRAVAAFVLQMALNECASKPGTASDTTCRVCLAACLVGLPFAAVLFHDTS